ncbi:MAG: GNAT family N-acetyltransferase [Pseudomonadota bacterium]
MFDFAATPYRLPVPLPQSPLFNAALGQMGVDVCHHALPGGTAMVMLRQTRLLGRVGLICRGPVWTCGTTESRVAGLSEMRRALGLRHLIVNPEFEAEQGLYHDAGFIKLPGRCARVARLSLTGSPADWLHRMQGKWRNRLRHARKQEVTAERHDFLPEEGHWLFNEDTSQQQSRHYRTLAHPIVAQMAQAEPGAAQLFIARKNRRAVAAMLFLCHGAMATYQIGWTTDEGRQLSAHNALMWEAMLALHVRGVQELDLGMIGSGRADGIDKFKLGTGAVEQKLGGSWLHSAWLAPLHRTRHWRHGPAFSLTGVT